jgi:GT2 family glycosyltransferase
VRRHEKTPSAAPIQRGPVRHPECSSRIVAVVLNYRTPHDTIRAVRSVEASHCPLSAVIVVDNASEDGSADLLARELPGTQLMVAVANGGFSAGCNLGIREALRLGADRVLLLNSDVVVPPDTVAALARALDRSPDLGIVAPVLVSRSHPDAVQSLGMSYSATTCRMWHHGHGAFLTTLPPFELRDVDGVSGCAMLIKREVIERIGMLTEEYFFGFEDLDFCLRARIAGFRTACVGTVVVLHEGSVSIGRKSLRRIYFATRNHLLLASRLSTRRSPFASGAQAVAIVTLNLAHVLVTSDVPFQNGLRGLVRGVRDHIAGRYGPGPYQ